MYGVPTNQVKLMLFNSFKNYPSSWHGCQDPDHKDVRLLHPAGWRRAFFVLLSVLISSTAIGLTSDEKEPAHFVSEQFMFNQKTGVTIFAGKVTMDQGTTRLIADQLTIYKDHEGKVEKIVAVGHLAQYSTLPDKEKRVLTAKGEKIEYYPKTKKAIILGKGVITQGDNTFMGEQIHYDIAQQALTSIPLPGGSQSSLIIQPQDLPGSKTE